jgi:STE24 endopeptidase
LNEDKATRYQRLRRRATVAEVVCGAVALGVLALPAVAGPIARWSEAVAGGWRLLAVVVFAGVLTSVWLLAVLPARLFLGPEPPGTVAGGEAHAAAANFGIAQLVSVTVAVSMWLTAGWWWALAGLALAGALTLAMRTMPVVLARFAATDRRVRPDLERRLAGLAEQAGVPVASVAVVPGSHSPAAFIAGVGRTHRVFLSDEVARDWSDDEIAVVVAHELGHHARQDLLRGVALSAAILTMSFWAADWALKKAAPALGLGGPADLGSWPLLLLVAVGVWLAATPLRHGQSRRHERRADEFALELTGHADAFAAAIRRLGARHLAEERPSAFARWFFHRHPSVGERLALANRLRDVVTR